MNCDAVFLLLHTTMLICSFITLNGCSTPSNIRRFDLEEARLILRNDSEQMLRERNRTISITHLSSTRILPEEYALINLALYGETNDLKLAESYIDHELPQIRRMARRSIQAILHRSKSPDITIPSLEVAGVALFPNSRKSPSATAEIVLVNIGFAPASITNVSLNGVALVTSLYERDVSLIVSRDISKCPQDGIGSTVERNRHINFPTVSPGGYAAFNIPICPAIGAARYLRFDIADGEPVKVIIPETPREWTHQVTSFEILSDKDHSKVSAKISYSGHVGLTRLAVNGIHVPFKFLQPNQERRCSEVLFVMPAESDEENPYFLELDFDDNEETFVFMHAQRFLGPNNQTETSTAR